MKDDMAKMEKYKVWEVIPREPHMRVVGARWVYTRKIDGETGKPSAYKARWVAKGFSQVEGVDFDELFAAVAHKDSIRVFLALVSHLDLECDQVDIQAFLNGDLQETIYLASPEGSNIAANKVLLLRKSLYGLRQSPRCFNKAYDKWLRDQGFVPTTADPCIYTRRNGSDFHSGNMILGSKLAPESPPLLYNPLVTIAQQVAVWGVRPLQRPHRSCRIQTNSRLIKLIKHAPFFRLPTCWGQGGKLSVRVTPVRALMTHCDGLDVIW